MTEFLQILFGGITAGSSYALMALALVIVYKTAEVVNFAQGELALASSYFAFYLLEYHGCSFPTAFVLSFVFAFFLGAFLDFAILRRAKKPNLLGLTIITIGLEFILLGLISWKFGADQQIFPFPIGPYDSVQVFGIFLSVLELTTVLIAVGIMAVLYLFYRYSKLGLAMKATQQNPVAARLMGIRIDRIKMLTWGISSLVGSTAGLLTAPVLMEPFMMWNPLLKGFSAAVFGGMTSLPGAVLGAYVLGVVESLFGGYISIEFKSVVPFAIIVLVLVFKPSGLFSRHYVKKV